MNMKISGLLFTASLLALTNAHSQQTKQKNATREKTAFQIAAAWKPDYDVRSDIAIVYGIHDDGGHFAERVKLWKEKGYTVHFMTGIAWGQYQDYFMGKWDGKTHWDEGQVTRNNDTIWHGRYVPYIVPTENYINYMKSLVKEAIDAGVEAVHLEEPEFWARSGYSDSFKNEWQKYYGFPWMAQHESPEATYLSSKLKYHLYYNALKEVFHYVKTYSKSIGRDVKCYVPTHSLINYSQWEIVSPEASLASLSDVDGYIAQVWTGTAREAIYFNGVKKERVFENAFLEYGSMVSMTAPTGRKVFFLTDPIEDRRQTWDDYKRNYQATYTAQLLYPMTADYEVMPWPNRIYLGKFKVENTQQVEGISPAYATQMQVMVNALNDMPLSQNKVSGSHGIGVLLSNSLMFQRFPTHDGYQDPSLSNFYGMAMPLLKRGVPVETVHIENTGYKNTLKDIKVLVMSYSNMKPLSAEYHQHIADWVKKGGVLMYYAKDTDPFQTVKEWWNQNGNHYKTPSEHLFQTLNIKEIAGQEEYTCGKGKVFIVRKDPKELVLQNSGDETFIQQVQKAYEQYAHAGKLIFKNNFTLQRGPYIIASTLDENADKHPLQLTGSFIDLFDPELPVISSKTVQPNEQAFLYDLSTVKKSKQPQVLATAARVYDETFSSNVYSFVAKSPVNTNNAMRIIMSSKPVSVSIDGVQQSISPGQWDESTKTLLLKFANKSDGVKVQLKVEN